MLLAFFITLIVLLLLSFTLIFIPWDWGADQGKNEDR